MSPNAMFVLFLLLGTISIVLISVEGGNRLGLSVHQRSAQETESSIDAVTSSVLALLALILAFTFGVAANRFDARRELVREEANRIRTAYARSDFLPEPDRAEAKALILEYLSSRISAVQSAEETQDHLSQAERIQKRLWDMAVVNALTPVLAIAYGLVIAMIGTLDRPISGLSIVSQQPLVDLLSTLEESHGHAELRLQ